MTNKDKGSKGSRGSRRSKGVVLGMVLGSLALMGSLAIGQSPWKQAEPGYQYSFPRDHAAHPDNKIEWWYYTGNVKTAEGRRFGYQVTFFRVGIDYAPANPSQWAVRDLYMTHLAVSDAKGQRYRYSEKLSRGGPGVAGAKSDRYYVWNEDWTAGLTGAQHKLVAQSAEGGIDLVLDGGKPVVI